MIFFIDDISYESVLFIIQSIELISLFCTYYLLLEGDSIDAWIIRKKSRLITHFQVYSTNTI